MCQSAIGRISGSNSWHLKVLQAAVERASTVPIDSVTRAQMAVFLVKTFNLP